GCIACVRGADLRAGIDPKHPPIRVARYWEIRRTNDATTRSRSAAADTLGQLLASSVAEQAVADVGVGVFLSGGVDSSTVAALLQAQSARQIETYTVAFDNPDDNEAPFAAQIAKHLVTAHTE